MNKIGKINNYKFETGVVCNLGDFSYFNQQIENIISNKNYLRKKEIDYILKFNTNGKLRDLLLEEIRKNIDFGKTRLTKETVGKVCEKSEIIDFKNIKYLKNINFRENPIAVLVCEILILDSLSRHNGESTAGFNYEMNKFVVLSFEDEKYYQKRFEGLGATNLYRLIDKYINKEEILDKILVYISNEIDFTKFENRDSAVDYLNNGFINEILDKMSNEISISIKEKIIDIYEDNKTNYNYDLKRIFYGVSKLILREGFDDILSKINGKFKDNIIDDVDSNDKIYSNLYEATDKNSIDLVKISDKRNFYKNVVGIVFNDIIYSKISTSSNRLLEKEDIDFGLILEKIFSGVKKSYKNELIKENNDIKNKAFLNKFGDNNFEKDFNIYFSIGLTFISYINKFNDSRYSGNISKNNKFFFGGILKELSNEIKKFNFDNSLDINIDNENFIDNFFKKKYIGEKNINLKKGKKIGEIEGIIDYYMNSFDKNEKVWFYNLGYDLSILIYKYHNKKGLKE